MCRKMNCIKWDSKLITCICVCISDLSIHCSKQMNIFFLLCRVQKIFSSIHKTNSNGNGIFVQNILFAHHSTLSLCCCFLFQTVVDDQVVTFVSSHRKRKINKIHSFSNRQIVQPEAIEIQWDYCSQVNCNLLVVISFVALFL